MKEQQIVISKQQSDQNSKSEEAFELRTLESITPSQN